MNIFLPYENPTLSAQALDDKRLLKQILETRQILKVAKGESEGYKNHPITKHYIEYPEFLIYYGYCCCCSEYKYRFHKEHAYYNYFKEEYFNIDKEKLFWIPFYAAGAKNSPNCVRTTENVSELYHNKLCEKWREDTAKGRPPKWTNREIPIFYHN